MKKLLTFGFSLLILSGNYSASAQESTNIPLSITHYKLNNGLQVILSEGDSLPLISVVVAYNVGSINERPGKTGLAYLLENLMFHGSNNISRMQHVSFINRVGGELNATTTEDKTMFFQTVPSNQLALILWLESDRMQSLEITASNIERAKYALIEEIRHRKAVNPYQESSVLFDELLFSSFAHHHPVTGKEDDVKSITVEDVRDFYSTYYIPNNAVLCIAGDLDIEKTKKFVRKYFETIPKGKDNFSKPQLKSFEKEGIVKTLENSLAPSPGFHLGYRIASPRTFDFYPLTIIEYILLQGNSSRLQKRLLKKDRTATNLSGGIDKRKNLTAFKIFVTASNEIMAEKSQKAIFSEINKLKSSLISLKELQKSKNMFKINYFKQYATSLDRAIFLVEAFLSKNSLDDSQNELNKYLAVTPSDIIGIMNRYFTQERILLNVKTK